MQYDVYKLKIKELIAGAALWALVSALFAFFFYRSFFAWIVLFALLPVFLKFEKKYLERT